MDGEMSSMIINALRLKAIRCSNVQEAAKYNSLANQVFEAKTKFHSAAYEAMRGRYKLPEREDIHDQNQ
ncbi:hypothetical protein KZ483_24235 [Paenibacillus sp. sptzw28]|uniref:hypothetical protein n=1 Tax=Paenibacillus sp. sptzw28 TaxID=715179 RepID=UPI001C6EBD68|nr:hypothetical protein [Paenibacillus sp. sptzw28]QYR20830.1 hypothetical protein KZ483_24235 [Paenibacillus sp. sptzw28]